MLIPVPEKRIWIDLAFRYERYIPADSTDTLSYYLLRDARVRGVYPAEEISWQVQRTIGAMHRDGVVKERIVSEVSALYGIPEGCVEQMVGVVC